MLKVIHLVPVSATLYGVRQAHVERVPHELRQPCVERKPHFVREPLFKRQEIKAYLLKHNGRYDVMFIKQGNFIVLCSLMFRG